MMEMENGKERDCSNEKVIIKINALREKVLLFLTFSSDT